MLKPPAAAAGARRPRTRFAGWDVGVDGGAAAVVSGDGDDAVDGADAIFHVAEPMTLHHAGCIEARSVVADDDGEGSCAAVDVDADTGSGTGVLGGVLDRFGAAEEAGRLMSWARGQSSWVRR